MAAAENQPTLEMGDQSMEAPSSDGMAVKVPREETQNLAAPESKDEKETEGLAPAEALASSQVAETQCVPDTQVMPGVDTQVVAHLDDAELRETEELLEAEMDQAMADCKKCGVSTPLVDMVVRSCSEVWCKSCNSLYTMLQRHMKWPPQEFQALDESKQKAFFHQCSLDKKESEKSCFLYQRVKDCLTKALVEETIRQRRVSVGGKYLPKSVYEAQGYKLKPDFETRNPRLWSEGLQEWTYCLHEVSIDESDIRNTIERSVLECEKQVRKRKAPEVPAVEDDDAKSCKSSAPIVLDLLSEDESAEAGQTGFKLVSMCLNVFAFGFAM